MSFLTLDNIDYNEIKYLIKAQTSQDRTNAILIPGQRNDQKQLEAFEEDLYKELVNQYHRIDLFVQSKSGEIARRLDHLQKQIVHLCSLGHIGTQKRVSVRRLERYSKVEGDVLKAGEEIQSLARFVGAQRLAFQKLLKKYKKWTGLSSLGVRFQHDILNRPHGFAQKDFSPLLSHWTDVLAAVRAPFDAGLSWKEPSIIKEGVRSALPVAAYSSRHFTSITNESATTPIESIIPQTNASNLQRISKDGCDIDFDTALATLPLGGSAEKAVYWIHRDNLVQTHVLLLQYTRLRKSSESSAASSHNSSKSSRRSSANRSTAEHVGAGNKTGTIVCDDPQSFAERRNSTTISDIESRPGAPVDEAAVSIRYCNAGEAIVTAGAAHALKSDTSISELGDPVKRVRLKRKALRELFDPENTVPLKTQQEAREFDDTEISNTDGTSRREYDKFNEWLQDHREIQPLVHLRGRRTRFIGLGNNETSGVWATLDQDVSMKKSSREDVYSLSRLPVINEDVLPNKFPHAILAVRREGNSGLDLIRALDDSHFTERVRGFSLETHAIATLCKPTGMPAPSWLPSLDRDIRKVPSNGSSLHRQSSTSRRSSERASTYPTSTSATSVADSPSGSGFSAPLVVSPATSVPDQLEAPPMKAFKKKRRSRKAHPLRKQISLSQRQRYWNEFDDGDEAVENEAYTIFVDPESSNNFPGVPTATRLVKALTRKIKPPLEKVKSWLRLSSPEKSLTQHQSRTDDYLSQRPAAEDSDLDSSSSTDDLLPNNKNKRRYSTFLHPRTRRSASTTQAHRVREALLFRCCLLSFLASFAFLLIAGILEITRKHRYIVTADIGSLVGMVASVVLAVVGVGMTVARKEDPGRVQWGCVLLGAVTVGLINTVLAVRLVRGI